MRNNNHDNNSSQKYLQTPVKTHVTSPWNLDDPIGLPSITVYQQNVYNANLFIGHWGMGINEVSRKQK